MLPFVLHHGRKPKGSYRLLKMRGVTPGSRFWRAIGAVIAITTVATACDSGVTVGPKLAKDQVLRVQLEDQPPSLDPGQTQYTYETALLRAVAEPLLKPKADRNGCPTQRHPLHLKLIVL